MVRGINRQEIFHDEEDRGVYLKRLSKYKQECGFKIYAYCLMNNHVHLLIREGEEGISDIMKKIGASYVYWYNRKYNRAGHLFQDRYKSESVEDDAYLLTVTRYIIQNPIRAGLTVDEWTSRGDYAKGGGLTDVRFILYMFCDDEERAKKLFFEYINEKNDDRCLEIEEQRRLTDEEAKKAIRTTGKVSDCQEIQSLEKVSRDKVLGRLKKKGLSIRQIERLTGVSRGVIFNA
ncbi:MAG: transposase [Defluviitaleaceae bacterium]|nr:transposase [Defluviitaleaceae bacterium]